MASIRGPLKEGAVAGLASASQKCGQAFKNVYKSSAKSMWYKAHDAQFTKTMGPPHPSPPPTPSPFLFLSAEQPEPWTCQQLEGTFQARVQIFGPRNVDLIVVDLVFCSDGLEMILRHMASRSFSRSPF